LKIFNTTSQAAGRASTTLQRQIRREIAEAEMLQAHCCGSVYLSDLGGAAKLRAMDVPVRTLMAFEGH